LEAERDRYGNLLLRYEPKKISPKIPPLVFVAHLDHPGFLVEKIFKREARLSFQGGVEAACVRVGMGVCFFHGLDPAPSGRGRITRIIAHKKNKRLKSVEVEIVGGRVLAGGYAMWDLPPFRIASRAAGKTFIASRACDDNLGAAALLCLLAELCRSRRPPATPVWVLLTRAEERGFHGALAAVHDGLLPHNARIISVECSRALPNARAGDGVIVRVGDRTCIFDPNLSAALLHEAVELRRIRADFRFQRRLMDGGTCEASVFCSAGYAASGLALPLGNYHNQVGLDGGKRGIGSESVCVADFVNLVRLAAAVARHGANPEFAAKRLRKRLRELTVVARKELGARRLEIP
jgi:endoglucanase